MKYGGSSTSEQKTGGQMGQAPGEERRLLSQCGDEPPYLSSGYSTVWRGKHTSGSMIMHYNDSTIEREGARKLWLILEEP